MKMDRVFGLLFLIYTASEAASSTNNGISHFEPQVALLCENQNGPSITAYHPQYMDETGKWQTDHSFNLPKQGCLMDKMDILYYCKRLYPKRDITNIVESSHYLKVGSWCKNGQSNKCKTTRWVKPYRCLEGAFQSDALLVPENCLFDHIHNQSRCWTFAKWNETALFACSARGLQLRSFAMLLPCGISLFSGVEFVCCPKHAAAFTDNLKNGEQAFAENIGLTDDQNDNDSDEDEEEDTNNDNANDYDMDDNDDMAIRDGNEEPEDDDEDDSDDNFDVSNVTSMRTKVTTKTVSTTEAPINEYSSTESFLKKIEIPDPYFTHFDPRVEHKNYKEAQERLEEAHREKVTRVMKDWSDLEERYQDMRVTDPKGAEIFKQKMTSRFQQTVEALENEGNSLKKQISAMHQQRVLAHINQRKREAAKCYTDALSADSPNAHRVQKCLQKLLRALHKDRAHAIAHYRHLLAGGGLEAAAREQPRTLERLTDIDRTVNQSLQMLRRFPDLTAKFGRLMDDYVQALRSKDETPGSLLVMTQETEAAILDKYRADVTARRAERDRQKQEERERKLLRKKEHLDFKVVDDQVDDEMINEDYQERVTVETLKTDTQSSPTTQEISTNPTVAPPSHATVDDAAVQDAVETVAAAVHHEEIIRVAHSMSHDLSHGEPTYSVRREVYSRHASPGKGGRSLYFTLAFAGMALMAAIFVGMAVVKRRNSRSPHSQGFVQVDQVVSPEERHVQNMQINGYENPTYKYFEAKE